MNHTHEYDMLSLLKKYASAAILNHSSYLWYIKRRC